MIAPYTSSALIQFFRNTNASPYRHGRLEACRVQSQCLQGFFLSLIRLLLGGDTIGESEVRRLVIGLKADRLLQFFLC